MKDNLIIVKAKITVKTTGDGGRIGGFKSGYRPNHAFELPVDLENLRTYLGDIQFDDRELTKPGETKIVTVRFLKKSQIEKYIIVGKKWFINEAARTLRFDEILEIQASLAWAFVTGVQSAALCKLFLLVLHKKLTSSYPNILCLKAALLINTDCTYPLIALL